MEGWVCLVVGVKEGMNCMVHWVWCINIESWNTEEVKLSLKKKKEFLKSYLFACLAS